MKEISEKRFNSVKEKFDYYKEHGQIKSCEKFGITSESLHREIRLYKSFVKELDGKEMLTPKIPKVLLFDLETSLMEVRCFSLFKPIIPHTNVQTQSHLHSWAGKWLNESEVFGDVQTEKEAKDHNDKRITESLWKAVDQADLIIAHNLKGFDRKVANTRFILNGLKPPSPYQQVDTLDIAKRNFRHASNRLDYLGRIMANDEKIHTNNQLWLDCFDGKKEALEEMYKYNKQDVVLLEEIYYELRPWMNSHPNLALIAESVEETCPVCLSVNLKESGEYITPAGRFDSLRCSKCGAPMRRRKSNLSNIQKKNLLVSTAR